MAIPPAQPARDAVARSPTLLQLVHSTEGGGVEVLAELLEDGLTESGIAIRTLVLYGRGGAGRLAKLKAVATTAWTILRERPQGLIAYQTTAGLLVGTIGRLAGCRLRIVHQTALPSQVHPVLRLCDKIAGACGAYTVNIANSRATERAFAGYPAAYVQRIRLIEHGLAPPTPRLPRAATWARHGVADDQPMLLHVGRLSDQKAQDRLIRALPDIARGRLALAGGGPNEASYRALARELGVDDRVHFLGNLSREEVVDLYGAADLFVFPSVWETFGLAPVEAAMVGLPVIASDLDVLREVLSVAGETSTVFVADSGAGAWASAINGCLANLDPGAAAARHAVGIRAKYSRERMIQAYLELINPALGGRVDRGPAACVQRPTGRSVP